MKTLPTVGKIISILSFIAALVVLLFFTSCGVTRVTVRNGADGTQTEVKINASNPTSVTASPNVSFNNNP